MASQSQTTIVIITLYHHYLTMTGIVVRLLLAHYLNDFMVTLAAQKSHIKAGADLLMSSQTFIPYVEINSLDKPSRPSGDCLGRIIDGESITDYDSDNYSLPSLLNDDGNSCAIASSAM